MTVVVRVQPSVGTLVLTLALGCVCASGAATANLRSVRLAGRGARASDDTEGHGNATHGREGGHGGYDPEVVDGDKAVRRVRGLTGPDFTKGDAAWKERLAKLVAKDRTIYSQTVADTNENGMALAAAAPLTTLYVLARNHAQLFPGGKVPSPLRVHVLGAGYTFEGRGDWQLLGEAMPKGVSLEVSLVLGTPTEADGVPEISSNRRFKEKYCRKEGNTEVRCIEAFHQDVMRKEEKPHLAMMFNPGFPQVGRRTWDESLRFLLRERIPTAVSAQVTSNNAWPSAGEPWVSKFSTPDNEDFAINQTLSAYGADVWSTTGSPFFVKATRGDGTKFIKNGVIELFRGLRRGAAQPRVLAVPADDIKFLDDFDWERAERTCDDDTMHDELRQGLETPVSDAYVRAADTVYLRYLRYAIDFKRKDGRNGFHLRRGPGADSRDDVIDKARTLMRRMERKEPLKAEDWLFLKISAMMD